MMAIQIQRRFVRHLLPAIFWPSCPEVLTRLGSRYGGWTIPARLLSRESVCYSFGVGEDVTFDVALASLVGCDVHLFDPTPRACDHVQLVYAASRGDHEAKAKLGDTYQGCPLDSAGRLRFHNVGVWSTDTNLNFHEPVDPRHVSHSISDPHGTRVGFRAPVRTVRSIAAMLGHKQIDLVKMDIEGAEMAVIEDLLHGGPLPTCLCIEFDSIAQGGLRDIGRLQKTISRLRGAGYRLGHIEDWNFLFIKLTTLPAD